MTFVLILYSFYLNYHERRLIESWIRAVLVYVLLIAHWRYYRYFPLFDL